VSTENPAKIRVLTPILLIIAGVIGFIGSFMLTIEKYQLLENPKTQLGCDINPFVSCSTVIDSWQSHIFGFPNPVIGVAGFIIPITIGAGLLARARFANWFWNCANVGFFLAWVFVRVDGSGRTASARRRCRRRRRTRRVVRRRSSRAATRASTRRTG
jgi:uncharacterized membrane protein